MVGRACGSIGKAAAVCCGQLSDQLPLSPAIQDGVVGGEDHDVTLSLGILPAHAQSCCHWTKLSNGCTCQPEKDSSRDQEHCFKSSVHTIPSGLHLVVNDQSVPRSPLSLNVCSKNGCSILASFPVLKVSSTQSLRGTSTCRMCETALLYIHVPLMGRAAHEELFLKT